ncbi:MAG: hypothetical protein HY553_01380 [Elusimicrobia bacterium]|nr:hypothetical protein [Elusimicrobiota bacterium]
MSRRVLAAVVVLLASSAPAFSAPQYMSRSRVRAAMRREPAPAPVPAPGSEPTPAPAISASPEPRLGRIVAQPYRTAPAAPPPSGQKLPQFIETEALSGFFPSFQSGGGFMPLTLGNRVQPRQDVVIEP